MNRVLAVRGTPLRVGVFFGSGSILGSDFGGIASYEAKMSEVLDRVSEECGIEFVRFLPSKFAKGKNRRKAASCGYIPYRLSVLERIYALDTTGVLAGLIASLGLLRLRRILLRSNIHLAYFLSPNRAAMVLEDIPFLLTIWDVGHRDLPGFAEVWAQSRFMHREALYSSAIPRASRVMVDSKSTANRLSTLYGLSTNRAEVIGLLPNVAKDSETVRVIAEPYLIYPATMWAHKNHVTILRAFSIVLANHPGLKLVLAGADGGNLVRIRSVISDLGIESSVIIAGVAQPKTLRNLISHAEILLMPSLLGPTNLPPLEAAALGTWAIVSDAHHFEDREFPNLVKVAALDVSGWADAIETYLGAEAPRPSNRNNVRASAQLHEKVFASVANELECW